MPSAERVASSRLLIVTLAVAAMILAACTGVDDGDAETDAMVCNDGIEPVLDLLRSGVPDYDYEPAGSFAAAAATGQVITGSVVAIRRSTGQGIAGGYVEAVVADVVDLDGQPFPDIEDISYQGFWPGGAGTDPIATPQPVTGVRFVAFVSPWSGVRGGWTAGVEGFYIACDTDVDTGPAHAVIESAAGPDDPQRPTLNEIVNLAAG